MNIDKKIFQQIQYQIDSIADYWNKNELLESHIEEVVFEQLFKYKGENVVLIPQKTIKTISGNFRPDIVLKIGENEIAIECDGKEFHQDEYYDEWRDSIILVSSNIQSIFRLRGKDINTCLQDLIYFISQKEPMFFNQDLINRLKQSIKPEFINRNEDWDCVVKKVVVYDDSDIYGDTVKKMAEIIWRNITRSFDEFYTREILISYLNPGRTIKELIGLKKEKEISTVKLFEMFFEKYPEYQLK